MTALRDYLDLVRAPAVLSVVGDTLAGGAVAGHRTTPRRLALPLASACLYSGGMALNDYADRELDAIERPERPIPSGRISAERALAVASGLTAAGLVLAAIGGGRRSLALAVPLAASVWTYDLVAKKHAAGPAVMAACRGLDVLMGAGVGRVRRALPAAVAVATHTVGVTAVSRGEVHGTTTGTTVAAISGTFVVAGSAVVSALRGRPSVIGRLATAGAAAAYLSYCLPAQLVALRDLDAQSAFGATKAGIRAMVPLQAAWAARGGSLGVVGALAAVEATGRLLRARKRRARDPRGELSET